MNATSRRMRPSPRRQNLWSPRPSTQTSPWLGRSWPWIRRKSVVLPAPLGPVISTSSPRATVKLTSAKTAVRPNDLLRCAMRTAGAATAAPLVAGREPALPLFAGFSCAATRSVSVARAPLEITPRCPTLSMSRLAQAGRFNPWTSWEYGGPAHLGRPWFSYRSATVGGLDQIGNEVSRVRRAQACDWIPAGRRRVAGDCRVSCVVAGSDVEEVVGVARRVCAQLVERGVDEPEPTPVDLVGDGDQPRPLRAAERRPADVVPTGAARSRSADQPARAVVGKADEDQRAGAGAGLVGDVRDAPHRADGSAARGQGVLVVRLAEHVAEAAAAERPADFGLARVRLALGGRVCAVHHAGGRVRRVGAEIGAADAGHQRVAGRPFDGGEGDRRSALADGSLAAVGAAAVTR